MDTSTESALLAFGIIVSSIAFGSQETLAAELPAKTPAQRMPSDFPVPNPAL